MIGLNSVNSLQLVWIRLVWIGLDWFGVVWIGRADVSGIEEGKLSILDLCSLRLTVWYQTSFHIQYLGVRKVTKVQVPTVQFLYRVL